MTSEKRSGSNFHSSFAASEFGFNGKVIVQGAPFSAIGISETVQVLSDGSQVTRKRTVRLYRDGEGRVRSEFGLGVGTASFTLNDAATGATYMVSARTRVALQLSASVSDVSLRRAKVITKQSPPEDLKNVLGETIESLGTRIIEGVEVEGVRVTSAVTVKVAGREQAGKVVYERWYSQELRRDVLIKLSDPRFGEAMYRLTGIDRAEPSPDLFKIPAGYKISPAVFPSRSQVSESN
jgi:hypothetical protein